MARKRIIHPGGPKDEAVARCSIWARYLWDHLPCHADREGRLVDKPFSLRLEIFPTDPLTTEQVDGFLNELAAGGLIVRYQVGGRRFIHIPNFLRYQTPHRNEADSVIPPVAQGLPPSGHVASAVDHGLPKDDQGQTPSRHLPSAPPVPDPDPVSDPVPDPVRTEARARDPGVLVDVAQQVLVAPPAAVDVHGAVGPPAPPAPVPPYPEAGSTTLQRSFDAQRLIDRFGAIRSDVAQEHGQGAVPWLRARGDFNKAVDFIQQLDGKQVNQAEVEKTMRLHLERSVDSQDTRDFEPGWAFGAWAHRFSGLLEEVRGLRRPARAEGDKPCSFHSGARNAGKHAPKHDFRKHCAECRHLSARAGPRQASPPKSAAEVLGGITNAGR